jgi:hypothetical protein
MPNNVRGSFRFGQGGAGQQQVLPLLILAAIVVIYIVLGILYESLVHPVTVLTTCRRPAWARCWRCWCSRWSSRRLR